MRALLALCLLLVSLPAFAQKPADDPSFRLRNDGQAPIVELFATPSGFANWGRSRLDGHPIEPGATRLIRLPRGANCVYDLEVVFAGGRKLTRRGTNLCHVTELHAP
jgi:hypothetical protein